MSYLNCDIPHFYTYLKKEYLYDLEKGHGEFEECAVFQITSIPPRAVMFTCMLDNGAQIARLPITAFVHKQDAPDIPLDYLELWGCFSYDVAVNEFMYLKHMRCAVLLKDRKWYEGEYMFTIDWCNSAYAENSGDGGFKTAHMIKLDNGCFALQPNNRMKWFEPSFITKPFPDKPDYLTNSHIWLCELKEKWATEDSQAYFYDNKEIEDSEAPKL